MVALTLRATKGAALTHQEVDDNFQNLSDAIDAVPAARELLTADRTYYVRTDGSNSNTGLANTSGGAWLTLQYAYNYVANNLDLGGFTVTIQIADGTYAGGLSSGYDAPPIVNGPLYIRGNLTNPENVVIQSALAFVGISGNTFVAINGLTCVRINLQYANKCWLGASPSFSEYGKMRFTGTAYAINLSYNTELDIYGTLVFTPATIQGCIALAYGAIINYAEFDAVAEQPLTMSDAFLSCYGFSNVYYLYRSATTGTFTGSRMRVQVDSTVVPDSGLQSEVPGNADGTVDATSKVIGP